MKLIESLIQIINEAKKPQVKINPSKEVYVIPSNTKIKYWDKNKKLYENFNITKPIFFNLISNQKKINKAGDAYWLFNYKSINDGKTYSLYTEESIFIDNVSTAINRTPKAKELNDFSDNEITNFILSYSWDDNEIKNILSNEVIYSKLKSLKNEKIQNTVKNFDEKNKEIYYNKLKNLNKSGVNPTAKIEKSISDIKSNFQKIGVTTPSIGRLKTSVKFVFSNKDKFIGSYIYVKNSNQYTILSNNILNLNGRKITDGFEIDNITLLDELKNKYKIYKVKDNVYVYSDINKKILTFYINKKIVSKFKNLLPCDNDDDEKLKKISVDYDKKDFQKIELNTEFKGI